MKRRALGGPNRLLLSTHLPAPFFARLRVLLRLLRPSNIRVLARVFVPGFFETAEGYDLKLMVIDARPIAQRNLAQLVDTVSDALRRLSLARQGFGELVTSHLRAVIAVDSRHDDGASWAARAYGSRFDGPEATNSHLLACNLIWAATTVRLTRDAEYRKEPLDRARLNRACTEAQRRFVEQFDDAAEWITYLRQNEEA